MTMKTIVSVIGFTIGCLLVSAQSAYAQDSNYVMTVELNNGTKMSLNTNDVKEITFLEGKIVVSGGSLSDRIDSLAKVVSDNYYDLYTFIKEKDAYYYNVVDNLKKKIAELEHKVDSLTQNQSGTLATNIVGTWLVTASDFSEYPVNAKLTFKSDGSTSFGYTYKVDGDTLEIDYLRSDGSLKIGTKGTFAISGKEATYTFIQYEKGEWREDKIYTLKAIKQE